MESNVASEVLSMSSTAEIFGRAMLALSAPCGSQASPLPGADGHVGAVLAKTGTTISERERELQAMWPGKASTSGTTTVRASFQAVPQTPRP